MEKVTENVYTITTIKGCNPSYVVTSEGIVAIDTPQMPTQAVEMREEILKKGHLRYLINTEHHSDHIFGNHYFAGLCPVIAHQDTAKEFWAVTYGVDPFMRAREAIEKNDPKGLALMPTKERFIVNPPTITFKDRLTLRLGNHVFELFNTPGHTRGETAVYVPQERVLFTGDTIFHKCQLFLQSAEPESWLRSLDFLKTIDADIIVPGHGPICDKKYIPVQSAFLREWLAAVASGIAKGWSKEECIAKISFLDRLPMDVGLDDSGPMVMQWNVTRLYDYLEGKIEKFPIPSLD